MTPTPAMHLLGKSQPGWFGLTMQSASGKVSRRQVVVGDQRRDAEFAGAATPSMLAMPLSTVTIRSGDCCAGEVDDFRRQAVAELEAVGHQVIDVGAEHLQGAHADGAGGGAVAVVVGDDQQIWPRPRWRRPACAAASMACVRLAGGSSDFSS